VASPAQLKGAWLSSVEFVERTGWSGGMSWFGVDEDFNVLDIELLEEEDVFRVEAEVTITLKWFKDEAETAPADEWPFDLTMSVGGEFWFAPGREERFVDAWLKYNGAYLLWPYVRAYASAVTGMGRLPRLTLETRQVPTPPDLESEEDVRVEGEQAAPNDAARDTL
jgi:hypothetical protein